MRRVRALVLLGLLAAAGCARAQWNDPDTLDGSTATRALAVQIPAAQPFFRIADGMAETSDPSERGVYMTLTDAGILAAYLAPSLLDARPQLHFRLTATGLGLVRGWRKAEHRVYEVPVGTLRLTDVTGVQMLSPRHAMVTYRYRMEPNAMGRLLLRSSAARLIYYDPLKSAPRDLRTAAAAPAADVAEMTRAGDGWRSASWNF